MEVNQELNRFCQQFNATPEELVIKYRTNEQENITDITINFKEIVSIPYGIFQGLPELRFLTIVNFKGPKLPRHLFTNQMKLKGLRITKSELEELDDDFLSNLPELYNFEIILTKIEKLPVGLFHHQHKLINVICPKNEIFEIPDKLFSHNHDIERIYLDNNNIEVISIDCFRHLSKLRELDLRNNELIKLPPDLFSTLSNLEIVNLSGNKKLPQSVQRSFSRMFLDSWIRASYIYEFNLASKYQEIIDIIEKTRYNTYFVTKGEHFRISFLLSMIDKYTPNLLQIEKKKAMSFTKIS